MFDFVKQEAEIIILPDIQRKFSIRKIFEENGLQEKIEALSLSDESTKIKGPDATGGQQEQSKTIEERKASRSSKESQCERDDRKPM
ncbi:unnamed protein product [Dracunculus medinensis]|uniref:HGTP_anticodon domain-containing protein n=1 Tax=Dracunculus medinensis TaxID=318479 RepID=A0A0N4U4J8_DRAME|nr:unnamed protein product [Dracunculus medinensis]